MNTTIRMKSGRTFEVPVFFEDRGLAVTPWIVVGQDPYPSKAHFAITQMNSGAIVVASPYTRLPDAIYVCQQLSHMLDWQSMHYDDIKEMLHAGEYPELKDFLAEEVYQGLVRKEESTLRIVRRTPRES